MLNRKTSYTLCESSPKIVYVSWIWPNSNPTHVDTNAKPATGAAVESTRNDSFSREIFRRSVTGRIVVPTSMVLA